MSSLKREYQFILEYLRWAHASKIQAVRVIDIHQDDAFAGRPNISPTRILVEISNFPISRPGGLEFPVTAVALSRFLESPQFREQFIEWYGAQIAASISGKGASSLRKQFKNLSVGRHGKLPPRIYLKSEYDRLILELKALHGQFPKLRLPLNREERELIIEFARETSARWLQVVDEKRIGLDQIMPASPQSAAKLILAGTYDCSEESIHSRLFRSSK